MNPQDLPSCTHGEHWEHGDASHFRYYVHTSRHSHLRQAWSSGNRLGMDWCSIHVCIQNPSIGGLHMGCVSSCTELRNATTSISFLLGEGIERILFEIAFQTNRKEDCYRNKITCWGKKAQQIEWPLCPLSDRKCSRKCFYFYYCNVGPFLDYYFWTVLDRRFVHNTLPLQTLCQ